MTRRAAASEPQRAAALGKPLLSICISTYNRCAWLAHSLPLVLEQARPYLGLIEVLVCDNASTDATPEVCARYRNVPGCRVHRNDVNVGMLGNLAVSAQQARGNYVWVLGDDDLMVEGAIERVLAVLAVHPDVELVYTNYAYTHFERPQDLERVEDVVRSGILISPNVQDQHVDRISALCALSENCFTAIYCLIFREDHARAAYGQDTSGLPFSSLPTCVPTTHYIVERLFDRPGYWVGDPCVVVNLNVSWNRYAALYMLERFPDIFERMEAQGADPSAIRFLKDRHASGLPHWVREIYFGGQREHLPHFSMARLVRRFREVPGFMRIWPTLQALHQRALAEGRSDDPAMTPERLQAILDERGPADFNISKGSCGSGPR